MDKETKPCPFCGGEILATAIKCKHCKQFLSDKEENIQDLKTKVCPYCSTEITTTAKKCKYCGEWLNVNIDKNFFRKIYIGALLFIIIDSCFTPKEYTPITSFVIVCFVFGMKLFYEKRRTDL